MKDTLSSLDLHFLVKELQSLLNAKVDKIYHFKEKDLLLQFHVANEGKKLLRIMCPHVVYLSKEKPETPKRPSGFCMYLRKKLTQARIINIEQLGFQRILTLSFQTKDELYHMIIELFSKGNIIITDNSNKIVSMIEYQEWKDRIIKAKEPYIAPPQDHNFLTITKPQFMKLIKESDKESLVKALALDLSLGGLYAEELLFRTQIKKSDAKPDLDRLFDEIKKLRKEKPHAITVGNEIFPFALQSKKSDSIESFMDAIDKQYLKVQQKETSKQSNVKQSKVERMITAQTKNLKKLEKESEENKAKGDALYANYQMISDILKQINDSKLSFKQMKEKLKDHPVIKDINAKTKEVTIEIKR